MAGALKHKQRSHRNYGRNTDFKAFERRAMVKLDRKDKKSFWDKVKAFFHRQQSK